MDAVLGNLKRVMRCVAISGDDAFAYVGTTTGEVLKFSIDRDGIQLPNDPDRVRPMMKKVSTKRVGSDGVIACECWTNPTTGGDNVIVGGGDGALLLLNGDTLNAVHAKADTLHGAVSSISLPIVYKGDCSSSSSAAEKKDDYDDDDEDAAVTTTTTTTNGGSYFFAGTAQGNRYRVNVYDWQAELLSTAHVGKVKDVVFPSACSDLFVTCSAGGDVRVWNAKKRTELLRIRVPNLECEAVTVADDGSEIVSGWSDGRVRSFFPESGKLKFVINDAHTDGVTALAIVANDVGAWTLVTGGRDGRVRGWRITSSHQPMIFSIKEHRAMVTGLKVSEDRKRVVTASADGSCLCFCLDTQVRKLALFEPNVFTQIAWHPDESQLLTTGTFLLSFLTSSQARTTRSCTGTRTTRPGFASSTDPLRMR